MRTHISTNARTERAKSQKYQIDDDAEFEYSHDSDESKSQQYATKRFIDQRLENFANFQNNAPVNTTELFDALATVFHGVELVLYRIGAKHNIDALMSPPTGLVEFCQNYPKRGPNGNLSCRLCTSFDIAHS